MDKKEVQKIVNDNIKRYLRLFQLQHWNIEIEYKRLNGEIEDHTVKGICQADPNYRYALIEFDPSNLEDEEDVLRTLRHELLHIHHASFQLYRRAVARLVSEREFNALDEVFHHVCEIDVLGLESMLQHGLKVPLKEEKSHG